MKKKITLTFSFLVLLVIGLTAIPITRDEIYWRWASFTDTADSYSAYIKVWPNGRHTAEAQNLYDERTWIDVLRSNNIDSYNRYLQLHPKGKHAREAIEKIESLRWQEATSNNTIEGYAQYLQLYPEGKYASQALYKIESLHWQEAISQNTIRAYNQYLFIYPQGKYINEANKRIQNLRNDKEIYHTTIQEFTEDSLRNFLIDFPGHIMQSEAEKALKEITEGRDIVDLINENKIDVEVYGNGIEYISLKVRRRVSYTLTVRIPVGTYFVSTNPSSQNMVTTARAEIQLTSNEWKILDIEVACANISRDIPSDEDRFTVQRSPYQEELAKVVSILEEENVPFAVRQAVIWIVTDDADYEDLGTLVVSQFQFYGGSRQINEYEAALALRILDKAGIDIKQKSIWQDMKTILKGLESSDLRRWLEGKMSSSF